MAEPVVIVEGVSKKFARSLRKAMWYGLCDMFSLALIPHRFRSNGFGARVVDAGRDGAAAPATRAPSLRQTEFWALKDVSFSLHAGECIGVVGANGAGKSTLFSVLSGIYGPSEGRVEIRGQLQALIALGAGFHPMLTGRENIYISAAVFGLTGAQIDQLLDRIIDFAELGDFIDAPVRSYSSGMLVRLGFSVAAYLDPDILLIDEVLAVGDSKFQVKCQDFTRKLWNSGKAIMLVSHYMHNIQGMCTKAIWLNQGRLMASGDVYEVTEMYQRHLFQSGGMTDFRVKEATGGFAAFIEQVDLQDESGRVLEAVDADQPFRVRINLNAAVPFACGRLYLCLISLAENISVFAANMLEDGKAMVVGQGRNEVGLHLPGLPLRSGLYRFYACVRNQDGVVALSNGALSRTFEIRNRHLEAEARRSSLPRVEGIVKSVIHVPYQWEWGTTRPYSAADQNQEVTQ